MPQRSILTIGVFVLLSLSQTNGYSNDTNTYLSSLKSLLSEGSVDKAIDFNENIYDAFRDNKMTIEEVFDLQMQISDYLVEERRIELGIEYFSNIRIGNSAESQAIGHKHFHLGRFYNALYKKKEAFTHLFKAKELLAGTKYLMHVYIHIAELNLKCGENKAFFDYTNRALSLAEIHTYKPKSLFYVHSVLVASSLRIGDIKKAEYHLEKIKYYSDILKDHRCSIRTKITEATIYLYSGRDASALRLMESIDTSEIKTPGYMQIINYYKGLGYKSENNNLKSIKYIQKSVQNPYNVKPEELAQYHTYLGISYRIDCQFEKAKKHLTEALNLYKTHKEIFHYRLRYICSELAYVYHLSGENTEALNHYLVGKELVGTNIEDFIYANVDLIGQYAEELSENYSSSSMDQIFKLMNETELLIQDWNFDRRHVSQDEYGDNPMRVFYKTSLEVLYFLFQYTESELVLDRLIKYSSSLQSYLYFNNKVNFDPFKDSKISKKLIDKEKALKSKIIEIKRLYELNRIEKGLLNTNEELYYLDSIQLLQKEYKNFMVSNASYESLEYYNWQKSNFGIKDVQDVLTDTEVVISYYNTGNVFYINLITKDDAVVFSKELNPENQKLIDDYLKAISKPDLANKLSFEKSKLEYSSTAFELYKFLLKDQIDKLRPKHKHLIIIPDNGMNSLPFKSLLTEKPNKDDSFKSYPFLVKSHSVAYEYSLQSFLYHKNKRRKMHRHSYVGVAPIYSVPSNELLEDYAEINETSSYLDFILRGNLVDLPASRQSVKTIAKQFDDGIAIVGKNATKSNLDNYIRDIDIVHFAMHAVMDNDNPELSQLLFSGLYEEQNLFAYELFNKEVDIELAMLSACETGTGKIVSENSLQNMSQAFSLAGCSSLTMSFYKIPDVQTGIIDKYFIEHILKGERIDESLRLSNVKYLEESSDYFAHPFYWSGIVMSGKTAPLYTNSPFSLSKYFNWVSFL